MKIPLNALGFLIAGWIAIVPLGARAAPPAVASSAVARPSVEAALIELRRTSPALRTTWQPGRSGPWLVSGLSEKLEGATPEERTKRFLQHWAPAFGVPLESLRLSEVRPGIRQQTVVYAQQYQGLRVLGRSMTITLDQSGNAVAFSDQLADLERVDSARIGEAEARTLAARAVLGPDVRPELAGAASVEKVVLSAGNHGIEGFRVRLARSPFEPRVVLIDGSAGRVIGERNGIIRE